jgi:hypothetical protein
MPINTIDDVFHVRWLTRHSREAAYLRAMISPSEGLSKQIAEHDYHHHVTGALPKTTPGISDPSLLNAYPQTNSR